MIFVLGNFGDGGLSELSNFNGRLKNALLIVNEILIFCYSKAVFILSSYSILGFAMPLPGGMTRPDPS